MDSLPQVPHKARQLKLLGNKTTITSITDFDKLEDRNIGMSSKLKFLGQGQGRSPLELDEEPRPIPTTSPADPLNWTRWRRELAFASLMLGAATIGSLKTMLITVNSLVATELGVGYTSVTALTGLPLIVGALVGVASQILSQSIGKRGIYLISSVAMLGAAIWNMQVTTSYAAFMASRITQGVGWGLFEALVFGSISDLFFEHERTGRANVYNMVSIFFTWGTPILGGYLSQSLKGLSNQIEFIILVQAISIVVLILGVPETTFDRSSTANLPAENTPSGAQIKLFLTSLKLKTQHSTRKFSRARTMQPIKSLYTPSTLLATLLSAPLIATSFGVAQSLSLIFTSLPTLLFPSHLGFLLTLPLVLSLLTYTVSSYVVYTRSKTTQHHTTSNITLALSIPGLIIGVTGLLSLGVYTYAALTPTIIDESGTVFIESTGASISLTTVSGLFGVLVAGSIMLSYTSQTHISASNASTPARSSFLVQAGRFWQEIFIGSWMIGMPLWIEGALQEDSTLVEGFKTTVIVMAAVSVILSSSVGSILWAKGREMREVDARVLGCVEELNDGRGSRKGETSRILD